MTSTIKPHKKLTFIDITGLAQALEMRLVRNECREFMTRHTDYITPVQQLHWFTDTYQPLREKNRMRGMVAYVHRDLVGYGLTYEELNCAKISGGLRPEYRGQGYGRPLFEKIIELAKTLGLEYIELEVRSSNTVAKQLYLSLGFTLHYEYDGIEVMRL